LDDDTARRNVVQRHLPFAEWKEDCGDDDGTIEKADTIRLLLFLRKTNTTSAMMRDDLMFGIVILLNQLHISVVAFDVQCVDVSPFF
jgi:hypothetical protein